MTAERLKELKEFANREYGISPSMACELVAEVGRLHAAVERVRNLSAYEVEALSDEMLIRDDVLAALEGRDGG